MVRSAVCSGNGRPRSEENCVVEDCPGAGSESVGGGLKSGQIGRKFGELDDFVGELEPEVLIHLAWYAKHGEFWSSLENVAWVEATLALMRTFLAAGGRRAVLVGTGTVGNGVNERAGFVENVRA